MPHDPGGTRGARGGAGPPHPFKQV